MPHFGPSRRSLLFGAACSLGCGHATVAHPARRNCVDLAAAPSLSLGPAEQQTHEIFLLLAMALVFDGWGVDRANPSMIAAYAAAEPGRSFPDYAGHHVGAVLVDPTSTVIGCALNRNVILNNSTAHAEARTIDNAFQLANAAAGPAGPAKWSFGSMLQRHVLYTTLEPCAQCAGIMELANISSVVFGQDDPGQRQVVNVLYNLTEPGRPGAGTLPVRASFMPYWQPLAAAYYAFEAGVTGSGQGGATRFLQTVEAYRIYRDAARTFEQMELGGASAVVLAGARQFRATWRETVRRDGIAPPRPTL